MLQDPATAIPVTLVTGFLGAGKTTLLRRLIRAPHGLRIGLILNEFGQAGIDAVETRDQAFIELSEGCACCLRNDDLVQALSEMAARGDIDRVLVEPSGLADPLPLAWTLQKPELAGKVRLDSVVVVVDPLHHAEAGREEWEAQVRAADVVIVSKPDLASSQARAQAEQAVREINRSARILTPHEDALVDLLLDTTMAPQIGPLDGARPQARHSDFRAVNVEDTTRYELAALEDLLESLPPDLFRAKGVVARADGGWAAFHVVAGRADVEPQVAPPPHGESRLAFFGRGLTRERVLSLLEPARRDAACR